jgi:outer membrane protein W
MAQPYGVWHGLEGLYIRAGVLALQPHPVSGPVVLSGVTGPATLAVKNGPIVGSGSGMSEAILPAASVGYRFWDQFSLETVLALPPTITLTATGTLATKPLATNVLGNIPTKVPALGTQLGVAKALPPVVTLTYRFFPKIPLRPYLGLGASYLYTYDAQITNPYLTQVSKPQLDIPGAWGFVVQGGLEIHLWSGFCLFGDFKYIAGLQTTATMKNMVVAIPGLPIYGQAAVGQGQVTVQVNPTVLQGGVGWSF